MITLSNSRDGFLGPNQTQEILVILSQAQKMFMPYYRSMSDADKNARTMGEGREGLVRLTSQIALAHRESLAQKDDPQELTLVLDYDVRLESLRQQLLTLLEMVTETQLINAFAAMRLSDRYTQTLQAGRTNDAALDLAMREIDQWNKRFINVESKPTEQTPPATQP